MPREAPLRVWGSNSAARTTSPASPLTPPANATPTNAPPCTVPSAPGSRTAGPSARPRPQNRHALDPLWLQQSDQIQLVSKEDLMDDNPGLVLDDLDALALTFGGPLAASANAGGDFPQPELVVSNGTPTTQNEWWPNMVDPISIAAGLGSILIRWWRSCLRCRCPWHSRRPRHRSSPRRCRCHSLRGHEARRQKPPPSQPQPPPVQSPVGSQTSNRLRSRPQFPRRSRSPDLRPTCRRHLLAGTITHGQPHCHGLSQPHRRHRAATIRRPPPAAPLQQPSGSRTGTSAAGPSFLAAGAAASTNNISGTKSLLGQ